MVSLESSTTQFSLDFGGVFEIYPNDRLIVRADAGMHLYPRRGTDQSVFTRRFGHNGIPILTIAAGYQRCSKVEPGNQFREGQPAGSRYL